MSRSDNAPKALRGLFLFGLALASSVLISCGDGATPQQMEERVRDQPVPKWKRTLIIQETTVHIEAKRRPAVDLARTIADALHTNTRLTGVDSDWPQIRVLLDQDLPDGVEGARRANVIRVSGHLNDDPAQLEWVVAHEMAHLRWTRERGTVAEGLAELTAALVTGKEHPAREDERCGNAGARESWCRYRQARMAWLQVYEQDPEGFPRRARRMHRGLSNGRSATDALDKIFGITDGATIDRLTGGEEKDP